MVISVLGIIGYSSCEKSDIISEKNNTDSRVENSKLLKDLSVFNNNLAYSGTETRGRWKNFLNIFLSDAEGALKGAGTGSVLAAAGVVTTSGGAIIGAVVYGAIASLKASSDYYDTQCDIVVNHETNTIFCTTQLKDSTSSTTFDYSDICITVLDYEEQNIVEDIDDNKYTLKTDVSSTINLEEKYKNVGKKHNLVLGILQGDIKLKQSIKTRASESKSADFITSNELLNSFDMDIPEIKGEVEPEPTLPNVVMELFEQAIEKSPSTIEEVIYLVNNYLSIINNSNELTENEKEAIKYGFATAIYSFNYWDDSLSK